MNPPAIRVALLTGGQDRSYAVGLSEALLAHGVHVEFIGSDLVDAHELQAHENFRFLNLRGDQSENASLIQKIFRIFIYYCRLIEYGLSARPKIFHILWNNKIEIIDRTLLMLYYRLCGRRIVLTAHNVNAAARDGEDSMVNRLSLRIQYYLCDQIFVHTEKMAEEMTQLFKIGRTRLMVVNLGINETVPKSGLTETVARRLLGLSENARVVLFFGQIAPYKGLDFLVTAMESLSQEDEEFCALIAGKVKEGHEKYWKNIELRLRALVDRHQASLHIQHIPDEEVERYFMAANVLVLPYLRIFQSGLPFLSYNFGLPIIVTEVGGLPDTVTIGETGFVCEPRDSSALERSLRRFFKSVIYRDGIRSRERIMAFAKKRYSWDSAAKASRTVYAKVLGVSEM